MRDKKQEQEAWETSPVRTTRVQFKKEKTEGEQKNSFPVHKNGCTKTVFSSPCPG